MRAAISGVLFALAAACIVIASLWITGTTIDGAKVIAERFSMLEAIGFLALGCGLWAIASTVLAADPKERAKWARKKRGL